MEFENFMQVLRLPAQCMRGGPCPKGKLGDSSRQQEQVMQESPTVHFEGNVAQV